jgi:ABC-type bacteriocin/lantibiotic exporters, contain an N-terminal double-glycine peptidase domain
VPAFTALNMNFSNIVYSEKPFEEYVKNINLDTKEPTTTNVSTKEKLIKISRIDSIELKNIFYRYNNSKDFVLENLNLKFEKNSLTGIVGKSGSGKSTLSKIVMGLLKPTNGEMRLNNTNVNQISNNWQIKIGYVPQDVFLIESSLIKNIALSQNDFEIDMKKINHAIENSLLKELVENSKDGLKFMISDNGKNISGGQKQRIGLARALYSNPDLLILDEPTSSLDSESQDLLNSCLLEIKKNKIVILITHSEKMLKNCDNVYKINPKSLSIKNEQKIIKILFFVQGVLGL